MFENASYVFRFGCVLLVWTGLVALQIGAAFGFAVSGLVGLALAVTLLGFLISASGAIFSRRWRRAIRFGLALLFLFSSFGTAGSISKRQQQASIIAAQPIIAAAENFHAATGAYPRSLGDLVPAYLPTEPRTKMGFGGASFLLSSQPDGFRVSFALPAWMRCVYDSRAKKWSVND